MIKDIGVVRKFVITMIAFLLFFALIYGIWNNFFRAKEVTVLKISAGKKNSDSYIFANAIKRVTEANYDSVKIELITSLGSEDSLEKIEKHQADMATVQADIKAGPSAQIVSNLYSDFYHLIVRKDAGISSFGDLKGKRMVLPKKGSGQWTSFAFTANHYGIDMSDIINIPIDKKKIPDAFKNEKIDAVFAVRAPMDRHISQILKNSDTKIINIDQGLSLVIKQPALKTAILPKGIYSGAPAIPDNNIETISVHRLLIAHKDTDNEAVNIITQVLFERRLELLKYTPLAGLISQPDWSAGTTMPIHNGAKSYYDKDKPSYFEENADFLALLLTLALMAGSGVIAIRNYLNRSQKNIADNYSKELFVILSEVKESNDYNFVLSKKEYLIKMLEEVIHQLDIDNVTAEGFQFFSFTWDKIYNMTQKKLEVLEKHS